MKKSQDLVLKGAVRFEQVQRFISVKKYFGVRCTLTVFKLAVLWTFVVIVSLL